MEPLKPLSDDNSYRELWIVAQRGNPDDWMTFREFRDEYWEEDGEPAKEQWLAEWRSWFPKDEYWHLLGCREDNGWVVIGIDNRQERVRARAHARHLRRGGHRDIRVHRVLL